MSARISKEIKMLEENGYSVQEQSQNNLLIAINGPKESPFQGGNFVFEFRIENFPFKAPNVICRTRIHHPNFVDGTICDCNLETYNWSPLKSLLKIVQRIQSLMKNPNLKGIPCPSSLKPSILVRDNQIIYNYQKQIYHWTSGEWEKKARQDTLELAMQTKS